MEPLGLHASESLLKVFGGGGVDMGFQRAVAPLLEEEGTGKAEHINNKAA